jgi:hypothetical protein
MINLCVILRKGAEIDDKSHIKFFSPYSTAITIKLYIYILMTGA